ncbi:MAG: Gmad2 immunoglobulin-like domain-containing protein [Patescibacteria group bacterium]
MYQKFSIILFLGLIVITCGFVIGTKFFSDEDTWICKNNEWQKHGNPKESQPIEGCGNNENKIVQNSEANIVVTEPVAHDEIIWPLIIRGQARVFENSFNYRVLDVDKKVLFEGTAMSNAQDSGLFGDFEIKVNGHAPNYGQGYVEVFDYSAKDGAVENLVSVPIIFAPSETMSLKVFFNNNIFDPQMIDCSKVFGVTRTVPKTEAVAKTALAELFKGVLPGEKELGYFSNINEGVVLNSIEIVNGTARVDFNEKLQQAVGGSCRISAIISQIENTLKQFSSINNVIISINGETEMILQP